MFWLFHTILGYNYIQPVWQSLASIYGLGKPVRYLMQVCLTVDCTNKNRPASSQY